MNWKCIFRVGLTRNIGGYTALSTKGVASLLSDTLWRALTFPITYLLVFILVVSALAQIRYVNRALQRFDSTQVIPVQFVLFTISVIIGSAVLYRDFQSADASRFGKFFGGCALTFLGVYLITGGRAGKDDEADADDLDDEENAIGLVDEERYETYRDEIDGSEEVPARRRSSVSFAVGASDRSRRSSQQQGNRRPSSTRTPPRLLSHTSAAPSESPEPEDHWQSPGKVSSSRPRISDNAISSPLLPSEAQRTQPPATPNNPSTPSRPSQLSRRSIARLTPGPYVSPLSSSLSAVVADELRRGQDTPTTPRRRPAALRTSKSQRATMSSSGDEGATSPSPLKSAQLLGESMDVDSSERPNTAIRSQSVSANFAAAGDDFYAKHQEGKKGKANERDGENDTP